jgi:hypothetical protein
MNDQSRRFTDREVALVLKRATEIDDTDGDGGRGMSLEELTAIAREVGISQSAIERAAAGVQRGQRVGPSLAGAPRVRKAVHAVSGRLDRDAIARLVGLIDERTDNAGSVTEALGSVRWTGADRLKSTRISITPSDAETTIEVVEKAEPRLRRIFHFLPMAWGAMLAGTVVASVASTPLAAGAIALAGVAGGLGAGRLAWNLVSRSSERRVRRLAEGLAQEAATVAAFASGPNGGGTFPGPG